MPSRAIFATQKVETSLSEIERTYNLQCSHECEVAKSTAKDRKDKLQKLWDVFMAHREDIREAAIRDRGNHQSETDLTEVWGVSHERKQVIGKVSKWTWPKRVWTPLAFFGARSWIHYEPKGVCLLISPWNFPFSLSFRPLLSAVAAGIKAIIKPSELTPHSSALIKRIVEEVFDEKEVAVVERAIETSQNLLKQSFYHISTLGKVFMEAASKHLASVTLELGGKSPVLTEETANIDMAARRIALAKTLNNGQICIASDYMYVHESKKDELLAKHTSQVRKMHGEESRASQSYSRIVNQRQHSRIKELVRDAKELGASLQHGGSCNEDENYYMEPTVLTVPTLTPNPKSCWARFLAQCCLCIPINQWKNPLQPLVQERNDFSSM